MKPEKDKTWEEVAAAIGVDLFLKRLTAEQTKLRGEIEAIYPALGLQAYRHRDIKNNRPWAVEQHISDIAAKDLEIERMENLKLAIVAELRQMAKTA